MSGRCHRLEHPGQAKNKQQSARAEHPGLENLEGRKERKSSARSLSWIIRGRRSRQVAGSRVSVAAQGGGTNKESKRPNKKIKSKAKETNEQQWGPLDWNIREEEDTRGRAQGARTGTSGAEEWA